VAADAFNSEVLAPLLEEAHPRSGDEAGCNPQVAADLALAYFFYTIEHLISRVQFSKIMIHNYLLSRGHCAATCLHFNCHVLGEQ
jgi:hypothetical protein